MNITLSDGRHAIHDAAHDRDLRVHQILEGTNEIMRVVIARRILAATNR